MLNKLVGNSGLAFTSSKPGCTQMINFFRVERGNVFCGFAGLRICRVPFEEKDSWQKLIEAYLLKRQTLTSAFLLLDARRGWMELDLELKRWLEFHNRRYQVVATKIDKLKSKNQQIRGSQAIRKQSPDQRAGSVLGHRLAGERGKFGKSSRKSGTRSSPRGYHRR